MKKKNQNFINFEVKIDELVHLKSRTLDNRIISDKDLISVSGFYFLYWFNRSNTVQTYSLLEISKEEFDMRKVDKLSQRFKPNSGGEFISDSKAYIFDHLYNIYWRRNIPADDCNFINKNSPLRLFFNKKFEQMQADIIQEKNQLKEARYNYSRTCGALSAKLGIEFVNVMQIGHDEEQLLIFKETYQKALDIIYHANLVQKRNYYRELFQKQRISRKDMLYKLGIKTFKADVQLLDLSVIENILLFALNEYMEDSKIIALDNIEELNVKACKEVYDNLMSSNRTREKQALKILGVIPEAIDFKRYSCTLIKAKLLDKISIFVAA